MKHLKTKLMAAVAMLLVATVMLTSASFAWFTISTAPEVANIKAKVTSNGNLEIALDAGENKEPSASTTADSGKNETWGNLVDLNSYFADTNTKIVLKPVQFTIAKAAQSAKYPEFGLDGRIKQLTALNKVAVPDSTTATNFKDLGGVYAWSDTEKKYQGDYVWAFEVDYWLRSNFDGNVSLTTAVLRNDGTEGTQAEKGLGSYTNNNTITVIFLDTTTGKLYKGAYGTIGTDKNYPMTLKEVTQNATTYKFEDVASGATSIALTANTAKEVKMFVFLDGTDILNKDMVNTAKDFVMNVQFAHDTDLNSMIVAESENGRNS